MDLIERDKAIDKLNEVTPTRDFLIEYCTDDYYGGIKTGMELAKTFIKAMPSAQPNVLEIGKWYKEGNYKVCIRKNYEKGYNEFCIQDEDGFTKWERSVADSYRGDGE